jgi:UV DNA damage endonuclease
MSEYEICDLPDYKEIAKILKQVGETAKLHNQRLSFHPGPFNQLASNTPHVVTNTIKELDQHSEIMNLIGLPESHMSKINIHIGAAYGDKQASMIRWCNNFHNLQPHTQRRLVVENDDKLNMYTTQDLYDGVYKKIGVPVTFDFLHHKCNPGELTEKQALELAISTWDTKPCTHFSSSRKLHEDSTCLLLAHADWVYEKINDHGNDIDIVVESKKKDLTILKYKDDYNLLLS